MSIFNRRKRAEFRWRLEAADLTERAEDMRNPCRGWYQIHTFEADREPDFGELEWCLDRKDALALVFLDIGAYRDRKLDQAALGRIRRILDFFRENGYDIVLRAAYDHQGKAVEREPYFWEQVKEHMCQIGELLQDCGEGIFVYQGLLVGNWGEMHTTRFQNEKKRKELWDILRKYVPKGTYAAVRRPVYWRQLHEEQGERESVVTDMGLFDDAMFASEDHLGTFGVLSRENGWGEAWKREEELAFEEELCRDVPNGGEAVLGEDFQEQMTPKLVEDTLRRMHVTYLNKVYDSKILDIWRQWRYEGEGIWSGKSLYDYVGAHLGYRLVVREVCFRAGRERDSGRLEITVENTGFASLYQDVEFRLEGRAEEMHIYSKAPETSESWIMKPEGKKQGAVWPSGETRVLTCDIPLGSCGLWLSAARKADGAYIRFANGCDRDGKTKIGELSGRDM